MTWSRTAAAALVALLACAATPSAVQAQDQPTSDEVVEASSDDLEALVAPVALFPDPILMLVLQGSVLPLQIVQADRFLDAHAEDATAASPDGLDPAVVGLLNYPTVVGQMSDYLEWTQAMGEAVVDQLEEVQVAIQDVRQTAYALGVLKTDEQQKVIVEDEVIRIMPASKDEVAIPIYDAAALLEAGEAAEAAEAAPEETEPVAAPAPAAAAPAPAPAGTQAFAPEPTSPAAPINYAPTAVAPPPVAYSEPQSSFWSSAATFAGGAAVGGLLGYVLADDDDNDDIDWDDINDEMEDLIDDEFDDFADQMRDELRDAIDDGDIEELSDRLSGREVNISDSNIVVGNQVRKRESIQNELRARQEGTKQGLGTRKEREKKLAELRAKGGDGGLTLPRAAGPKPATAAAPKRPQVAEATPKVKRQVELPKGDGKRRQASAAKAPKSIKQVASTQQRAKSEGRPRPQASTKTATASAAKAAGARVKTAAFVPASPRREVNRDRERGQASRAAAALGGKKSVQSNRAAVKGPKVSRQASGGGGGLKNVGGSGKAARAASDRGKQSRGGGRRRGN